MKQHIVKLILLSIMLLASVMPLKYGRAYAGREMTAYTEENTAPGSTDMPSATDVPISTDAPEQTQAPQVTPSVAPNTSTPMPTVKPRPKQEYVDEAAKIKIEKADFKVVRTGNKKAKLSWKALKKVSGYLISFSETENGKYKKLKYITDPNETTLTVNGLKKDKTYYFEICAFQAKEGYRYYSYYSPAVQCTVYKNQKLYNRLLKLRKKFPQGRYWNHVGKRVSPGQSLVGFVTKTPCNHADNSTYSSTCNYYVGKDGIKGYQCWGFASYISDKLFGKSKYKSHKSFKKAKIGDHVRYNNSHSVIVMEKHKDYIVVCEVNYGYTCMINWGRKIRKEALADAVYYTRY